MFRNFFTSLRAGNSNEPAAARRKYMRRSTDRCVSEINGQMFPVENWSEGGFLINADERTFNMDDNVKAVMKFKLSHAVVNISQTAHVVRKARNKIAFQFDTPSRESHNLFQSVIDDYVTSEFANSQTA